jgi:uncharacterized protein (DUF305 family)
MENRMKRSLALSLSVMALLTAPAAADNHDPHAMHADMHDHAHQATPAGLESDATKAFVEANNRMHEGMTKALTGDPDVDFMQGMIPHHQGAIDMAEIVLKYGKDPETRKLAEEIIKAQTAEIAVMKDWLAKRGK